MHTSHARTISFQIYFSRDLDDLNSAVEKKTKTKKKKTLQKMRCLRAISEEPRLRSAHSFAQFDAGLCFRLQIFDTVAYNCIAQSLIRLYASLADLDLYCSYIP